MRGMVGRAREPSALATALALLALTLSPTVHAQSVSAGVQGAQIELSLAVPVDEMIAASVPDRVCSDGALAFHPENASFVFSESETETGCAEARFTVAVPEGTDRMTVSFQADRRIEQASPRPLPVGMVQELRWYDARGELGGQVPYFDRSEGPRGTPEAFTFSFALEGSPPNATIGWLFSDEGYAGDPSQPNPLSAQAFAATVSAPQITFPAVAHPVQAVHTQQGARDGDLVERTTRVAVDLDEVVSDFAVALSLRVDRALELATVEAPGGRSVPLNEVQVATVGDATLITLPAAVVAAYGPGRYEAAFTSLEPAALIGVGPLPWALLVIPAVAGGFAAVGAHNFARQATGHYRRSARWLVGGWYATTAWYVEVVFLALVVVGMGRLAFFPPSLGGWVVFSQLALVTFAFLALWRAGARNMLASMEAALEERRRHEAELQRSNQELEQFAYVASHDLQEPLRMVSSYVHLLGERYGEALDERGQKYVRYSVEGATRMQALINDLLDYSRVGNQEREHRRVDTARVVEQVMRSLRERIDAAGGRVQVEELPPVVGDEAMLGLVFQNLLGNAIKFRGDDKPVVRISAERDGDTWRFAVRDNGIGIDPRFQDKIFQVFKRLHKRSEYDGTGIGLAISKRVIERHGGRIWVESEPGEGATFFFTLPTIEGTHHATEPPGHPH